MNSETIIETKDLSRTYYGKGVAVEALKQTDLSVRRGEFIAVTGPSGAGKSTLLYLLGLLDSPSTGEIILDSIDTSLLSEREKTATRLTKLGYIFQNYSLVPELTAAENIMVTLMMQGSSAREARGVAREALERVGLLERMEHYADELSGGEQQRVAVARAIAHRPLILFADEPTANLDSAMSQKILDLFLELNHDGQTIVMVTHEEAYSRQAERIITLKDGVIVSL